MAKPAGEIEQLKIAKMALRGLSEDYYPSPSPLIEPSPSPGAVVEIELPQAEAEEDDTSGWHSAIATGVMGGIMLTLCCGAPRSSAAQIYGAIL